MTTEVWASIKDNVGEGKRPPTHFELVWDDTMLNAKTRFDAFDHDDKGLIDPEAMLEVVQLMWETGPERGTISQMEQIKLTDELLNYRQRANQGKMSFTDFAAWRSRLPQILGGLRSLRNKQVT